MNANLIDSVDLVLQSGAVAAGTTDITPSNGVDCADFDGVLFVVAFGAITAGAVTSIKAQQSSDDGSSDTFADIVGTSVTVADDEDNTLFYLDIHQPTERYVRCVVDRGTQNAVVDSIIAIPYGAHAKPTTKGSSVSGGEKHSGAAEGTA